MDEAAKKESLRMIPYGLYVVGVRNPKVEDPSKDLNAFIASWVTQCSFKPPLVAVGIRKASRSHDMVVRSKVFTLNILSADQKAVAQTFFKDLAIDDETMSGVAYRIGETGAPIFPSMPSYLECKLVAVHDVEGDHDLFIGRVVAAGHRPSPEGPLTHANSGWHYGG
jgi:flavin reductase (DIM6/NTAB) family NADH-FMN oxidoreductase RutF